MDFLQSEYHTPCRRLLLTTPSQRESINDEIATLYLSCPSLLRKGTTMARLVVGLQWAGRPTPPAPSPGNRPSSTASGGVALATGIRPSRPGQHCIVLHYCCVPKKIMFSAHLWEPLDTSSLPVVPPPGAPQCWPVVVCRQRPGGGGQQPSAGGRARRSAWCCVR